MVVSVGGGGRIRTIEAKRSRFTVCPLWPLGNSPRYLIVSERLGYYSMDFGFVKGENEIFWETGKKGCVCRMTVAFRDIPAYAGVKLSLTAQ